MNKALSKKIDHLFRHEYGNLVSSLTSKFGGSYLDWIEDAVQEALYKAMKLWGFQKIPEKPSAWLYKVAYNSLLDRIKKEKKHRIFNSMATEKLDSEMEIPDSRAIQDEQLKMIFACCNPAMSEKNSLLLSLKLIGGFSVREIARALLMSDESAKKAIQRARADFQAKMPHHSMPEGTELSHYLNRVLKVIYLIFNEGYKASDGDSLVKEDLCGEALRLSLILSKKERCNTSELLSLISLICFKAARFSARINQRGEMVILENQDRKLYSTNFVSWGYYYYNQATKYNELSPYFLEAAIEFQYHIAASYGQINWGKLLAIHNKIQENWPSPKGELNRLIVFSKVYGPKAALELLLHIETDLLSSHLYFTFKADLYKELGQNEESKKCLQQALELVRNDVERKYLLFKLN